MSLRIRRGGAVQAPSPPSEVFGPVGGTQPIRDGAGARTVLSPGAGGVTFTAASNINTLIAANPANTIFVGSTSASSTFNNFRNIQLNGRHPRFYFPGPIGTFTMQGAGTNNEIGIDGVGGLELYGGRWQGYGLGIGGGAAARVIDVLGPTTGTSNTIIQDAEFRNNGQIGVGAYRYNSHQYFTMTLSHCTFQSNGRYAFVGSAEGSDAAPGLNQDAGWYGVTIEYCLVVDNNVYGRAGNTAFNPLDDAGAQKFGYAGTSTWRYNWYHDNYGLGIWFDGYNRNISVTNNVTENDLVEFFYEISRGGLVYEHNYCRNTTAGTDPNYPFNNPMVTVSCSTANGGAALSTQKPYDGLCELRYNDIDAANGGGYKTPLVIYNHSGHPDSARSRNFYVHHNRVWLRGTTGQQRVGLADACAIGSVKEGDIGTSPASPGLNLFDYNEYHVADTSGSYWEHDTAQLSPGARTFAQFQARGHEAHGTVVAI